MVLELWTMSLNKSPDVISNAISFPFYSANESGLIDLVKTVATPGSPFVRSVFLPPLVRR